MNWLIVHQYFKTPDEGGGLRSWYLANEWSKKNIKVSVITTWNKPHYQEVEYSGFRVYYLPIHYDQKLSFIQRAFQFIQFVIQVIDWQKGKTFDLAYIITTPLTTGFIGLYLKWIKKTPYSFDIGDLWPEVPLQMKLIPSWTKFFLQFIEKIFYKEAKHLISLSPSIAEHIKNVSGRDSIIIPNFCDQDAFNKNHFETINNPLIVSYIGSMGIANDLYKLLYLAEKSTQLPIQYILMGDGSEKQKLQQYVSEKQLSNVFFKDFGSQQVVVQLLAQTDVVYVSFASAKALNTGSPNKFFDGLAAGKIIIINFEGWLKEMIHQYNIGYASNSTDETVSWLEQIISEPSNAIEMKRNSKKLAENFDKTKLSTLLYQELITKS